MPGINLLTKEQIEAKYGATIDSTPTENSTNLVTSDGVFRAINDIEGVPPTTGASEGDVLTVGSGGDIDWASDWKVMTQAYTDKEYLLFYTLGTHNYTGSSSTRTYYGYYTGDNNSNADWTPRGIDADLVFRTIFVHSFQATSGNYPATATSVSCVKKPKCNVISQSTGLYTMSTTFTPNKYTRFSKDGYYHLNVLPYGTAMYLSVAPTSTSDFSYLEAYMKVENTYPTEIHYIKPFTGYCGSGGILIGIDVTQPITYLGTTQPW